MPARYTNDCVLYWHGVDETTPPGHTVGIGRDAVGTLYLWLFKGQDATEEAFRGSINIPNRPGAMPVAYDSRGSFAGIAPDARSAFARLVSKETSA